jgi:creatinine amidohydrolase
MPESANGRVRQWAHLTGREIDAVDRDRAVVTVAVSPLEVHGPHLPTVTDNLEARGLSARAISKLQVRHPELECLELPPIYVAADVLPHVGSVMFRQSTIVRVLEDLGRSLAAQGFRRLWVTSFHGGPRHFVPIEYAAHRVNRRYGGEMVSVFSLLAARLTGGGSDLSGVIAERLGIAEADLKLKMAEQGKRPIPDTSSPSVPELLRGFKEKLKYYEDETYAGRPALASAELGDRIIDLLADHAVDALSDVYTGRLSPDECHSPLWPIRWVFLSERFGRAFERLARYRQRVF